MKIRVVSFNIRCCDDPDENTIELRAPRLKKVINDAYPDVIGLQEYRPEWEKYISDAFPEYEIFNKYRSKTEPESAPILYRKDKFEVQKTGYFWLSDTPDTQSRGYDTLNYERICEYAILKRKDSGEEFVFASTHFGFGDDGQVKSARLLKERLLSFGLPVAVVGDFNMQVQSPAYSEMTKNFDDVNMKTTKDMGATYHGYHPGNDDNMHIDYCFANGFAVLEHRVLRDDVDGKYPSDHFGLFSLLEI